MLLTRTHHRFSVDDYEVMIKNGILTENDRVELIRGEILEKMPIGDPHIACVYRLNRYLNKLVGDLALLGIQSPIRLTDSQPEPDITLLRLRDDFYVSGKPEPNDIYLIIEVADSSLEFDRDVKGYLYAEEGIREYWIVDVAASRLEVRRGPLANGSFAEFHVCDRDQFVEIEAFPGLRISVADIVA